MRAILVYSEPPEGNGGRRKTIGRIEYDIMGNIGIFVGYDHYNNRKVLIPISTLKQLTGRDFGLLELFVEQGVDVRRLMIKNLIPESIKQMIKDDG